MIQASGIFKSYGGQVLFEDAGFTVNAGERIGLVGRNGHGKTTLFRMVLGEEHPDAGRISVPDGYTLGHLSQHIGFTSGTVLEEACLGLGRDEDGADETYKAEKILSGLGFSREDFALSPYALSGGYQIRLNLAKVLAGGPNLLLLDEPTNYLDILSIRWLSRFLREWKNELILITHDRRFMDSVTTHTMGIHRARIRKIEGPTERLYGQILLEEAHYEKTRLNDEKRRREIERFINRFRAKATKASAVQSRIKTLEKREQMDELARIDMLDFRFNCAPFAGKKLLEAEGLRFSYSGAALINGAGISIGARDRIAVIGKNGKGKTTLLNMLAGELAPQGGEVRQHQALRLAHFGQTNVDRLDPSKTVEEEILDALPEYSRRTARGICGLMMFEGGLALKKISVLSGGEKSRVLLGKLLASPANLLLLDEPTNHLDMESVEALKEAINSFEGAVVIVTHNEELLNEAAERLVIFDEGKVSVFEGTYAEFLEKKGWSDERQEALFTSAPGGNRTANKKDRKKDLRRQRADVISERSRALGTLQKEITGAEDRITELEGEIAMNTESLIKASENGGWEAIKDLSKSIKDAREEIEALFTRLEELTKEFDLKSGEFDRKMSGI
ncbi:MAG: ABC-F family ATP-binding cassette domain-containing protein [Nitrospiraceae bacterium]|nr:ABC-F family ATP-binding cassette domain-containing protein [Nitrospiraceae bacterium]